MTLCSHQTTDCNAVLGNVPQEVYLWGAHETSDRKLSELLTFRGAALSFLQEIRAGQVIDVAAIKCPADVGAVRRSQMTVNGDPLRSAGIQSKE